MAALGELLLNDSLRSSLDEAHSLLSKAFDIRVQRLGPSHEASESLLLVLRKLESRQARLDRQVRSCGAAPSVSAFSRPGSASSQLSTRPRRRPLSLSRPSSARPAAPSSCASWDGPYTALESRERFLYDTTFFCNRSEAAAPRRSSSSLCHILQGPNTTIDSVLEAPDGREVRQALEQEVRFKSAWYHLPGRQIPACLRQGPLRPPNVQRRVKSAVLKAPSLLLQP